MILALGNGESLTGSIEGIIPSGAVMAVHVTAATTKGEPLEESEWKVVVGACQTMFGLNDAKAKVSPSFQTKNEKTQADIYSVFLYVDIRICRI